MGQSCVSTTICVFTLINKINALATTAFWSKTGATRPKSGQTRPAKFKLLFAAHAP